MTIWSAEIKELTSLYESLQRQRPDLLKELEKLVKTDDANVVMLYSRRCLEVIVTDLCEYELGRPIKTEPLKGVIDKLNKEEKVPSNIIASMLNLNTLSTFGAHPKEFDPEQVKPVLNNLTTIIRWYIKYKDAKTIDTEKPKEVTDEISSQEDLTEQSKKPKNKLVLWLSGLALFIVIVVVALFVFDIIGGGKQAEELDKSIAVLPFDNLSNDPEQEYFVDGMVDEILDRLFKVGDLKVTSRTSSMRYKDSDLTLKEIARELGVSAILEGSVRKIGDNVRITAQLIDTRTDSHLWSDTFEGDVSDVFSIQSEVAQQIAKELRIKLTSSETDLIRIEPTTTNQLAIDFYRRGRDYWSRFQTGDAIDMFSRAIQEDSLFTEAYIQRAMMHINIYWSREGENWQDHVLQAKEDREKAIQLNPELIEVKFAEAVFHYQLDRNYDKSLNIITELKAEAPSMADLYAYASYIMRRQRKLEESVIELKKALELDPFNANYFANLIGTYKYLHQYDNMIECARQGLSLIPDYEAFHGRIFNAYLAKTGDLQVALKESGLEEEDVQDAVYRYTRQYVKLIELINNQSTHVSNQHDYRPKTYRLAFIYNLSGNTSLSKIYADSAIIHLEEGIIENPNDYRLYATMGKCYALIGNVKEAVIYGEKAVDMMPVTLDALVGILLEEGLMEIYILTGNYDLALDKLEYLLSVPSLVDIGNLKIDPIFDNLRDLPRFQEIISTAQQ
jgi:TolB-like protein/HEPN domain-containing protein